MLDCSGQDNPLSVYHRSSMIAIEHFDLTGLFHCLFGSKQQILKGLGCPILSDCKTHVIDRGRLANASLFAINMVSDTNAY